MVVYVVVAILLELVFEVCFLPSLGCVIAEHKNPAHFEHLQWNSRNAYAGGSVEQTPLQFQIGDSPMWSNFYN